MRLTARMLRYLSICWASFLKEETQDNGGHVLVQWYRDESM